MGKMSQSTCILAWIVLRFLPSDRPSASSTSSLYDSGLQIITHLNTAAYPYVLLYYSIENHMNMKLKVKIRLNFLMQKLISFCFWGEPDMFF